MRTKTVLAASILAAIALPAHAALFGLDAQSGDLLRIDTATGATTLVGSTGLGQTGGLDRAPDGSLYAYTLGPDAALYRIDPGTAAAERVGPLSLDVEFDGGLAIVSETMGYGVGRVETDPGVFHTMLFQIDLTTGALSRLRTLGFADISGLAARDDGKLIALANSDGFLEIIDPGSPDLSRLGFLPQGVFNSVGVGGLAGDGSAGYLVGKSGPDALLYSLNLANGKLGEGVTIEGGVQLSGIALPAPGVGMILLACPALAIRRRR